MGYHFFCKLACKRLMWGKIQYENRCGQGVNRKQIMGLEYQKKDIWVILPD